MGTAYKLGRVFLLLFVTASILSGCKYSSVRSGHINFSPDNSNLVSVWCFDDKPCAFAAYDIEKNTVSLIRNHTENSWNYPVYSADGSKIALSSYDKKTRNSQIATIDPDGSNYEEITTGAGFRSKPNFSRDGNEIIYVKATLIKYDDKGLPKYFWWDVHKLSLKDRKEVRLTFFQFGGLSAPYFLDKDKFIFSANYPSFTKELYERNKLSDTNFPPKEQSDFYWGTQFHKDYERNFFLNNIFVMSRGSDNLLRPEFLEGPLTTRPSASADGKRILFSSVTKDDPNARGNWDYDLFIREDGKNRRLTKLGTYLSGYALSPDGSKIAFLSDKKRSGDSELWLMNSDGSGLRKIDVPKKPENCDELSC